MADRALLAGYPGYIPGISHSWLRYKGFHMPSLCLELEGCGSGLVPIYYNITRQVSAVRVAFIKGNSRYCGCNFLTTFSGHPMNFPWGWNISKLDLFYIYHRHAVCNIVSYYNHHKMWLYYILLHQHPYYRNTDVRPFYYHNKNLHTAETAFYIIPGPY